MDNPFIRRATEFFREDEAFLAIVSPEPVSTFLVEPGSTGRLYDRLVLVIGTPGSGKTTLARLFQYPTLNTLLRNSNMTSYQPLLAALSDCGAVANSLPTILACRLPLETDYRDLWEFPYPDSTKVGLLTCLIQSRAVLGWIRNLVRSGISLDRIRMVPRQDADAAIQAVGGIDAKGLLERARSVETSLYNIVAGIIAPPVSEIEKSFPEAYRPFDVIEQFEIDFGEEDQTRRLILRPVIILDDAHLLHPAQFRLLLHWLTRRELRVGRWVLTRLDVLHPTDALGVLTVQRTLTESELPAIAPDRDTTHIMLQSVSDRTSQRGSFRKMAKDMANRYLRQMQLFAGRKLENLADLLSTELETLAPSKAKDLRAGIDAAQKRLKISDERRESIWAEVNSYQPNGKAPSEEIRLEMLSILMHRYAKRIPQKGLFPGGTDPEPSKPLRADSSVVAGAEIHLMHRFDRPYYFGIDELCDAGSENAEQFLRLAAKLVEAIATRLIRSKPGTLDAATQHKLLREQAESVMSAWSFPQHVSVSLLIKGIAALCLKVSLEPNAPLGGGANAYGVPQEDFNQIPVKFPDLARVLQFGVAYNAFTLVPQYPCKNKDWCLIELGGLPILKHGLTLRRGGFVEGTAADLATMAEEV